MSEGMRRAQAPMRGAVALFAAAAGALLRPSAPVASGSMALRSIGAARIAPAFSGAARSARTVRLPPPLPPPSTLPPRGTRHPSVGPLPPVRRRGGSVRSPSPAPSVPASFRGDDGEFERRYDELADLARGGKGGEGGAAAAAATAEDLLGAVVGRAARAARAGAGAGAGSTAEEGTNEEAAGADTAGAAPTAETERAEDAGRADAGGYSESAGRRGGVGSPNATAEDLLYAVLGQAAGAFSSELGAGGASSDAGDLLGAASARAASTLEAEPIGSGRADAPPESAEEDDLESNYDEVADEAMRVRPGGSSYAKRRGGIDPPNAAAAEGMLGVALGRAVRTLSSAPGGGGGGGGAGLESPTSEDLLRAASGRASAVMMETYQDDVVGVGAAAAGRRPEDDGNSDENRHADKRKYLGDPCVTGTALAHSLWSSTIVPNVDTVIDATCGNGKDAVAMARMLFASDGRREDPAGEDGSSDGAPPRPELLCIDIQRRACENTERSLMSELDPGAYASHVRVVAGSHAPLPRPRDERSVGLVAYNLGYLPGADGRDAFATQTVTTLYSLADAALLLRAGGLLSVMTYPGTSPDEADAVRYFCEGLAMLTTRDPGGWAGYVDGIPDDGGEGGGGSGSGTVRELVRSSLQRVVGGGEPGQTWRVFEHRPLGRPLSPILVTAMRIK